MASQTCDHCGAIVAGDEQFCPSCGSFMDPMSAPQPRPRSTRSSDKVISISSDGSTTSSDSGYEEFSLDEPPNREARAETPPPGRARNSNGNGTPVECPSCGAVNPGNNRHCQECGARLKQGPLPTAPRPAVQATAGVRAALAISGLLLGVILIALFFNIFTGEDPEVVDSSSTTPSTAAPPLEPAPIDVLDETCTPDGIGSLICANLTSGTADEYQVSWIENQETGIEIRFTFLEPMAITAIHWTNIEDATRFQQNYRASTITVESDDSVAGPTTISLQDVQGTQVAQYSALQTTALTIRVIDAYQAQVVGDNVFDEMAITEIEIWGRPVITPTGTTSPTDTGSTTTTTG